MWFWYVEIHCINYEICVARGLANDVMHFPFSELIIVKITVLHLFTLVHSWWRTHTMEWKPRGRISESISDPAHHTGLILYKEFVLQTLQWSCLVHLLCCIFPDSLHQHDLNKKIPGNKLEIGRLSSPLGTSADLTWQLPVMLAHVDTLFDTLGESLHQHQDNLQLLHEQI